MGVESIAAKHRIISDPSGSGVGLVVRSLERSRADMRINLCGDETFVPQQFLNTPNIRASIQEMGGKTVPEGMGSDTRVQSTLLDVFFQHSGNASRGQPIAKSVSKGW